MALTDDQFIKKYMLYGTKKLAEILGQNPRTVARKRQKIETERGIILIGPDPRQQVRDGYPAPEGHIVKGWSELVRADDDDPLNRIVYWVKTNKRLTDQLDECRVAAEAMAQLLMSAYQSKPDDKPRASCLKCEYFARAEGFCTHYNTPLTDQNIDASAACPSYVMEIPF